MHLLTCFGGNLSWFIEILWIKSSILRGNGARRCVIMREETVQLTS